MSCTIAIEKFGWKASHREEDCRVLTAKNNRKSAASRRVPVRRNVQGLYPLWHWLLEKTRTLQVSTRQHHGANLEPRLKNSRETLSLQPGGYDARRTVNFWHDLAVLTLAALPV